MPDAMAICGNLGGHLAIPSDVEEARFMATLNAQATANAWVAIKDYSGEGEKVSSLNGEISGVKSHVGMSL